MSTATATTYVDGWQETGTPDGYRVVGCRHSGWFALGLLNTVIACPPAHLSIWEALDWFRAQQSEEKERETR